MTQTTRTTRPGTGPIPEQHRPAAAVRPPLGSGLADTARRAFAIARGLRSLRPVPARAQEPYGESDGH
ncbi:MULTISPECIES: hypothetical protein [Kitasatospora]|uniref:Uncharacterized protein n=1 Tax=Kitasatospora cystarginea TaxID=58350 RepID=A0ABN3E5M1_9ACTN